MRKVIVEFPVYRFKELSREAKNNVKEWFLNAPSRRFDFFGICNERLLEDFPASEFELQYAFCCEQGDGVNIYGSFAPGDMLRYLKEDFYFVDKPKEMKRIAWYLENYGVPAKLPRNERYTYCMKSSWDILGDTTWNMEYEGIRGIDMDLIQCCEHILVEKLASLCEQFEEFGEKFFFEISDEEVEETCESNDWEFTEDGVFWG